ncbi:hypothetical protein LU631_16225 [Erwinia tracheiphila]|uniref:Uncharacterized protein n=1 Tax=Erwinia tracheiphila TaxID=65700 RepID=A0A0M2KCW8_9GAMM|nr:hypothetical protein [Erwinia tracheiphila]AXF76034.1 hypothetical protein AV903_08215 [Erwinia tracheiphila]EOS96702.1 hypothetical protein ETR_01366 [Erwinia tracheiphila PSU-1]KKF34831.1 hypothetical protein SY86_04335 [Erwinia tracheiphila]UIA85865.1 hypothetical protein LU604_11035 [Erwinia tracheiphila]UIA90225.1 hypothetical protein LU631_16225 [Erwinia tracheiphila]
MIIEREMVSLSSKAQIGWELLMNVLTFKNDTVSVGDVFASSWGYEQTNVTDLKYTVLGACFTVYYVLIYQTKSP